MFKIQVRESGVTKFSRRKGRNAALARLWRAALVTALTEYASGKLAISVRDRFKPSAMGIYGFARRSDRYEHRQVKALGGVTPYVSPRTVSYARVALAALKGNALAAAQAAQNALRPHMRDLVRQPGTGFAIRAGGQGKVSAEIRWPGARILNRAGNKSATYRQQFADLSLGGGRDSKAIIARAWELYMVSINQVFAEAA